MFRLLKVRRRIAYTWRTYDPDGQAHDQAESFRAGAFMTEVLPYFARVSAIMNDCAETRVYLGHDTNAAPLLTFFRGSTAVKKGPGYYRHVFLDALWGLL